MVECKEGITGKAIKVFIHEFYKILSEINGEVRIRDYLIGGEISPLSSYIMLKGANALPNFIRVIDLTKDAVQLKSQVRKSYGSLINWGLRELEPQIIDKNKIKWGHFLQFRELHIRESGRETRSIKTWRRQYDSVLNGEGFLVFGHLENKLISAGYFSVSQTNCCYGVSASRRDLFHKPLFHSLMWKSMLYAKEIGCRWFEVGEQHFLNHPTGHHVTKKEQGISDFKAGFGGKTRLFLDLNLSIKESIL
mgnify:FL=1